MERVFVEAIVGREIEAAAKVPSPGLIHSAIDHKHPNVHVRGGRVGVSRLHNEGDGAGLEAAPGKMGMAFRRRRGKRLTDGMGELHRRLLNDRALGEHRGRERPPPSVAISSRRKVASPSAASSADTMESWRVFK